MKGLSSACEVFLVFLRLGLTSFGGPVAHLSYFREEFVDSDFQPAKSQPDAELRADRL